jgi:hypothetical protein
MANFTQSVREIIQQNASGQDLSTIDGIYEVGAPIFFGPEMNVISNEFRERFEKGFLLKFFNDELGYETFSLWRIAFQEKIFNNADYINLIYDTLDKQIFADYKVRKKNAEETSKLITDVRGESTNTTDGSVTNTNSGITNESNSNTNVLGEQTKDSSANTVEGKGTITDSKSGTETLNGTGAVVDSRTGSDRNNTTGTDTLTKEGNRIGGRDSLDNVYMEGSEIDTANRTMADSLQKTGYDLREMSNDTTGEREGTLSMATGGTDTRGGDVSKKGTEKITDSYNSTVGQEGSVTDTRTQTGSVKDNSFQVNYDTPMGSLQNMRSPGGSSAGKGSSLITDETFNYMSSASEAGSTRAFDNYEDENVKSFSNDYAQTKGGSDTREVEFLNRKDEHTEVMNYGRTQAQGQNETSESHVDGSDKMNYNSQATTSRTGKDTITHSFNDRHNTRQINDTDRQSYGENNVDTKDLQSETTYGSQNTQSRNLQDEKVYDTDLTRERDTLDITNNTSVGSRDVTTTDNGSRNVTDNSTSVTDTDTTVTNNDTRNTDQTGAKSNMEDEVDYAVNLEMLYRSIPLLDKVWDIFKDLFMFIYS